MISFNKLHISNIGRFVGTHTVDLTRLGGLSQIDGIRIGSGGSSGSGKSTIIKALEYVLGVNDTPTTVLQSRLTEDPLSVTLEFDRDGEPYTLKRGKSGGIVLTTPTEEIKGSAKETEEKLLAIIGLPADLIRRMFCKRQKERGFFLSFTPKQTYNFLSECTGHKEWSVKQAKAKLDLDLAKGSFEATELALFSLESKISSLESAVSGLFSPDISQLPSLSSQLEATLLEITLAQSSLEKTKHEQDQALSLLKKPIFNPSVAATFDAEKQEIKTIKDQISSLVLADKTIKDALYLGIKNLETKKRDIAQKKHLAGSITEKMDILKNSIIVLKQAKCSKCEQDWSNDSHKTALQAEITTYRDLQAKKDLLDSEIALGAGLDAELAEINSSFVNFAPNARIAELSVDLDQKEKALHKLLEQVSSNLRAEHAAYEIQVDAFDASVKAIRAKYEPTMQIHSVDLGVKQAQKESLRSKIELLKQADQTYQQNKKTIQDSLESLKQDVVLITEKKGQQQKKMKLCELAHRVIEGYVNFLFQDTLAQIANRTNEILAQVPNTATTTISFDVYRELKSGVVKEEINILVNMDNETKIPLKSLSGGEESSVELAVDLAVVEMVEQRTGKGFNFLILDEPFTGLDDISRANCLEILQSANSSKKVVIVDHSQETLALITQKVKVIREGQFSRIEQ